MSAKLKEIVFYGSPADALFDDYTKVAVRVQVEPRLDLANNKHWRLSNGHAEADVYAGIELSDFLAVLKYLEGR
jgi:hypothetical protein